jgi:hypothetical protein
MIQKNTLALIEVAIIAPTSRKAARPGEPVAGQPGGHAHQQQHQRADDRVAVLARPKSWQMASYSIQKTTRKHRATATAAPGDQFMSDLSTR